MQDDDKIYREKLEAVGKTMVMLLHELKNMIQLAVMSEEWLNLGIKKNNLEHVGKGAQGIQKALHEMQEFCYEMQILTPHYKGHFDSADIRLLAQEIHEKLKTKFRALNIHFEIKVLENFPEKCQVDSRAISRALSCLIKNSMGACDKENSHITVTLDYQGNDPFYTVKVEDNGCGMNAEVKQKMMRGFYSAKSASGSGLGFLIVQKVAEIHNGKVTVESAPGKGTSVILRLLKNLKSK